MVAHGAAIRVAVGALLGWPDDAVPHPARPRQLRLGGPRRAPGDGGELRLAAYNRAGLTPISSSPRARWLRFRELPDGDATLGLWRSW